MKYNFEFISERSENLNKVIALGDSNKKTLGHLPRGAFREIARKRNILVVSKGEEVLGYLLFRVNQARQALIIVHLCVKKEHRGKGLSTFLVDEIIKTFSQKFSSIGLTCRDDYENAVQFWSRYGFQQGYSKRSRSIKEHYSTYWFIPLREDLFSRSFSTATIKCVLDANIIVKLRDDVDDDEIQALKADWITKEVDFYYTRELLSEFQRDNNIDRRNRSFNFLRASFEPIDNPNNDESDSIYKDLKTFLHTLETVNNISDRRQLAEAIVSKVQYFITLDEHILACSDRIESEFNLSVVTPLEFIISIDKIENHSDYQPKRLGGVDIVYRKLEFNEIEEVRRFFQNSKESERKSEFAGVLKKLCTDEFSNLMLTKQGETFLGLFGYEISADKVVIHLIRTIDTSLGDILFKQLLSESISLAKANRAYSIVLDNKYLTEEKLNILYTMGFRVTGLCWEKVLRYGIVSSESLLGSSESDIGKLYSFERLFFPAKIKDLDIPTFIVPIKAHWASQLFDYVSANATLLGSKPELTWNRENVYYRSSQKCGIVPNSRILWYLSGQGNNARNQCIIGCSYLDDVEIDKPKVLWAKYKRIGVYEWKHIYKQAKGDVDKEIMAISFSDTEIFNSPISLSRIQKELKNKSTFQSPLKVTNTIFEEIYKLGNEIL
jgi:predicted nucleic acid-binding protein/predicted GNAT family acetyltransferase/predicted transcriptional regulator